MPGDILERNALNLHHQTLPEIKDFNVLGDAICPDKTHFALGLLNVSGGVARCCFSARAADRAVPPTEILF